MESFVNSNPLIIVYVEPISNRQNICFLGRLRSESCIVNLRKNRKPKKHLNLPFEQAIIQKTNK